MRVWVGAQKPRMLELIGRAAGGWVCALSIYMPPEVVPRSQAIIDAAAHGSGRRPSDVRRLYNVVGSIGARDGGQGLQGPAALWFATRPQWARDLCFRKFIFC